MGNRFHVTLCILTSCDAYG